MLRREKTIVKKLSNFVNGKGFAVVVIILMTASAIGLFQATIHLLK